MPYLTNWRMQLASRMLRDGQSSVAAIALEVGFESEAAFARAFKRLVETPPAAWRRMQGERGSPSKAHCGNNRNIAAERPPRVMESLGPENL